MNSLQCTVYTELFALYSVHWILCTVQCTLNCLDCTVYTEFFALYSEHWFVCTVQCTLNSLHCTVFNVQCTLNSLHFTVFNVQCTLNSLHCTVNTELLALYSVQCTLNSLHCTVYTDLFALYSEHWVACTVQCTLSSLHYTVYSVQCTVYSVHRIVCKSYRIITYLLSGLQLWPPGQDFHIVFSWRWSIVVKENDGGSILNSVFALCTAGLCTAWGELGIVLQNIRFKFQKSMPMQNQQYTFLN